MNKELFKGYSIEELDLAYKCAERSPARDAIGAEIDRRVLHIEDNADNLSKAVNKFLGLLEKGGKRAVLGEQRMFGGRKYVKTSNGWKYYGKGKSAKDTKTANDIDSMASEAAKVAKDSAIAKEKASLYKEYIKEETSAGNKNTAKLRAEARSFAERNAGKGSAADVASLLSAKEKIVGDAKAKKEEKGADQKSWKEHGMRDVDGIEWLVDPGRNVIQSDTKTPDGKRYSQRIEGTLKEGYTIMVHETSGNPATSEENALFVKKVKAKNKVSAVEQLAAAGNHYLNTNILNKKEEKGGDTMKKGFVDSLVDLIKGKTADEGEERTWANGKKYKKTGGKWVEVVGGKGEKKEDEDKSKSPKKEDEGSKSPKSDSKEGSKSSGDQVVDSHEIGQLTHLKSISESDPAKAYEIFQSLSPEAQQVVPQDVVNKLVADSHSEDAGVDFDSLGEEDKKEGDSDHQQMLDGYAKDPENTENHIELGNVIREAIAEQTNMPAAKIDSEPWLEDAALSDPKTGEQALKDLIEEIQADYPDGGEDKGALLHQELLDEYAKNPEDEETHSMLDDAVREAIAEQTSMPKEEIDGEPWLEDDSLIDPKTGEQALKDLIEEIQADYPKKEVAAPVAPEKKEIPTEVAEMNSRREEVLSKMDKHPGRKIMASDEQLSEFRSLIAENRMLDAAIGEANLGAALKAGNKVDTSNISLAAFEADPNADSRDAKISKQEYIQGQILDSLKSSLGVDSFDNMGMEVGSDFSGNLTLADLPEKHEEELMGRIKDAGIKIKTEESWKGGNHHTLTIPAAKLKGKKK